jgi:serine O-acetyltransferase
MIHNKQDYRLYLSEDRIALGVADWSFQRKIIDLFVPHYTYKFQRKLRRLEYYRNCKRGF